MTDDRAVLPRKTGPAMNPQTFLRVTMAMACLLGPFILIMGIPWLAIPWLIVFALVYVPLVLVFPGLHVWFFTCLFGYYLLTCLGFYLIGRRHRRW